MFLLFAISSSSSTANNALVDGTIVAKTSNLTGFDLWFPNGTYRFTKKLMADYICNDWWYDVPFKTTANRFNPKGFALIVVIAVLMTFCFTASFPMLVLTTKQNKYIIKISEKVTIIVDFLVSKLVAGASDDDGADFDKAGEEAKLHCLEVFAYTWMVIGTVAMFFVSVVVANAVFTINDLPSVTKVSKEGYCYYVDSSNLVYSEEITAKARVLQDESSEGVEVVPGTALVSIENDGSRTFFSSCVDSFYEPMKGSKILWRLETPYKKVCKNISMKRFDKYHTAVWYGCGPKNFGKRCHYKFEKENDDDYNVHFASCCSQNNGNSATNNDQCGVASNARFDGCAFGAPKYRMRSHEFVIKELPGWQHCEFIDTHQGFRLYRQDEDGNEVDMTDTYLVHAEESNAEHILYPFGWQTANKGTEIIILTQSNMAGDGLGGIFYWGSNDSTAWMKNHFDMGNLEYGWKDSAASIPAFAPVSTRPPFKQECRMTFTTDPSIKELAEFKTYCTDVIARVNEYGNVVIGTSSSKMCVVNIKGTVLGEDVNTSVNIDEHTPAMFHMSTPMYWQCNADHGSNKSAVGGPCGYTKPWTEFIPEYYETNYLATHGNGYDGSKGEPSESTKPSIWTKIKQVLIIIAIVVACLAVAIVAFIVVMKITAKTQCCREKCPSCANFGMRLCNRNYVPPEDVNINLNIDDIKN